MCGFGGIFNSKNQLNYKFVSDIATRVNYRGPDSCNVIVFDDSYSHSNSGNSAVFFNRLAVLDLNSRSNQPFHKDGYYLLFNGEIYNQKLLKSFLVDVTLETTSDTEILFYLLVKYGTDAISMLNGMFSFVFINTLTSEIFMARDRYGIKPLYYKLAEDNTLVFGSEIDTIINFCENIDFQINPEALSCFFDFNFTITPLSIVSNINKLEPGQIFMYNIKSGKYLKKQYYELYEHNFVDCDIVKVENLLISSIQSQLVADVNIGMFLSSGIDSSLLLTLITKKFPEQRIKVFTVEFDGDFIENENIDACAFLSDLNNRNLEHIPLKIQVSSILDTLNKIYNYIDEPISDPAILLNYLISKEAQKYVKVVLSGDGADELFWGYDRYNFKPSFILQFSQHFYKLFKLDSLIPIDFKKKFPSLYYSKLPVMQYLRSTVNNKNNISSILVSKKYWFQDNIHFIEQDRKLKSFLDLKLYLVDGMLAKVDKTSMANSLEVRVPYLDNDLSQYAINSKIDFLTSKKFKTKSPLKEILRKYHPNFKIHKNKKGFSFPLSNWMKNDMKDYILNVFNSSNYLVLGLDSKLVHKKLSNYFNGDNALENEIWMYLNLFIWHKHFKSKHNNFL